MLRAMLATPSNTTASSRPRPHTPMKVPTTTPYSCLSTFHPFPRHPLETQLLILKPALSNAIANMYLTRYFHCQYTGDWTQDWNRCSIEKIKGIMRTEEPGYVEGKFKSQFKARRRELMRDGLAPFLSINRAWRNEVLKFLEERQIRETCWDSVMSDRKRRVLRKWKDAVYLLDIGEGREMEKEKEEEGVVGEEFRAGWGDEVGSVLS